MENKMENLQNRFRSWALWLAIAALVVFLREGVCRN